MSGAVGEHRVDGFEKHYFLWDLVNDPAAAPYVAANVNLWPETVALLCVVSSTNPCDQVVWGGKPWKKIG